jgi:hypothetical protein
MRSGVEGFTEPETESMARVKENTAGGEKA